MADTEDDLRWSGIADAADRNDLLGSIVALSTELGADVSISIHLDGSRRHLSISTGRFGTDEDETEPEEAP